MIYLSYQQAIPLLKITGVKKMKIISKEAQQAWNDAGYLREFCVKKNYFWKLKNGCSVREYHTAEKYVNRLKELLAK